VAFLNDFAAAEELARAEGKSLFLDFETEWCGPCHVMDEWVYTADVVVDADGAVLRRAAGYRSVAEMVEFLSGVL